MSSEALREGAQEPLREATAEGTATAGVRREPPVWVFELGLLLAAVIWGGAFVVLKDTLDAMTPIWIIAVRFCLATLVMVAIFHRRLARYLDASHVLAGVVIGLPEAIAFIIQNVGL
ncbi:MAG: DMT family transporter, partial [Parafannyhessea umbonata]